jgi:hypothetical protein
MPRNPGFRDKKKKKCLSVPDAGAKSKKYPGIPDAEAKTPNILRVPDIRSVNSEYGFVHEFMSVIPVGDK